MPLVAGICKNCGAAIKFDDSLDKGVCEYCGTPFVKEDVIVKNYNNFKDATVIMNDASSIENKLESAEAYLVKFKEYEKAEELFKFVVENKAADYRGWWGLVRAHTKMFEETEPDLLEYSVISKYYSNAQEVATNEQKILMEQKWKPYDEKVTAYLAKVNDEQKQLEEEQRRFEEKINRKEKARRIRKTICITLAVLCSIFAVVCTFFMDIRKLETEPNLLTAIYIIPGINLIVVTILGLIGSARVCRFFPALSAALFWGIIIYRLFNTSVIDPTVPAVLIFVAAIIVAVCYAVPSAILEHFVKPSFKSFIKQNKK